MIWLHSETSKQKLFAGWLLAAISGFERDKDTVDLLRGFGLEALLVAGLDLFRVTSLV